jgi:hypothetical protein
MQDMDFSQQRLENLFHAMINASCGGDYVESSLIAVQLNVNCYYYSWKLKTQSVWIVILFVAHSKEKSKWVTVKQWSYAL